MAKPTKKPANPKPESFGLPVVGRPVDDAGLSLDQLSAAFAEMLSTGEDPYPEGEQPGDNVIADVASTADEFALSSTSADEACEISPRTILEAMLFVGSPTGEPLASSQVASLMRGVRPAELDQLVSALNQAYEVRGCPYEILSEGAGYRLALRGAFHRVRDRFYGKARQAKLSQAAIEILSLVAYNQPLTSDDVNRLRTTSSGAILNQLVRRELLRLDRSDPEFRRGRYYTTPRFLQLFGLESLDELPRSEDVAAINE